MNIEDIILPEEPVIPTGDPDGCNRDRAESALLALGHFARERGLDEFELPDTIIRDFLTNLFHLFDYLPAEAFRYSDIAAPIRPTLSKLFAGAQENYQEEVSE
jgi:hypothetical protein